MMPGDIPLFASFLLSDAGRIYDRWEFDVSVGPGVDPGPFTDPALRSAAIYLTQVKIDAIGWAGNMATIFEVKPEISITGFGQLIAYRWYYAEATGIYANLAAITDFMSDQYKILYDAFGIEVHFVREATQAELYAAVQRVKELNGGELKPTRLVWLPKV
jgi:hypothetical protein